MALILNFKTIYQIHFVSPKFIDGYLENILNSCKDMMTLIVRFTTVRFDEEMLISL